MRLLRPGRPALTTLNYCRTYHAMPRRKTTNKRPPKEPKPQLTHFLCLPLVNSTSLPQLETSLAAFKAAIPSVPRNQDDPQPTALSSVNVHKPLIPEAAIRPLGTLHLTLGVMSLPTKERLQEALEYFESLDLGAMLREAEGNTQTQAQKQAQVNHQSFNLSLESLDALPQESAATVLHAVPVDPTSRLYPFCESLREKFFEAGFMLGESKGRPLLLHATVVNTIYVKGRRGGQRPRDQNYGKKNERFTFDARDLLACYRDYYVDDSRTTPRSTSTVLSADKGLGSAEQEQGQVKRPFVWARDFPVDSVCICEMGAKKLDPSLDPSGLHGRLGEKYQVVAERPFELRPDKSGI